MNNFKVNLVFLNKDNTLFGTSDIANNATLLPFIIIPSSSFLLWRVSSICMRLSCVFEWDHCIAACVDGLLCYFCTFDSRRAIVGTPVGTILVLYAHLWGRVL